MPTESKERGDERREMKGGREREERKRGGVAGEGAMFQV